MVFWSNALEEERVINARVVLFGSADPFLCEEIDVCDHSIHIDCDR